MTPSALVMTSLLLGVFVLAGGGYGGLYGAGRLTARRHFMLAAYACYGIQLALVITILVATPLAPMWKTFIVISGLVYAVVPPMTWRFLQQLHD